MSDTRIEKIRALQVYDSRANPTIQVDVTLRGGACGRATVPSGASTGAFEAVELRDGDPAILGGKSVLKAVDNIHRIITPALIGQDATQQSLVDHIMLDLDGTPNKGHLGANAILGVSMATAWAAAQAVGEPLYRYLAKGRPVSLPVPMIQMIGGGLHANRASDIQDYLVIPVGATSFTQAVEMGVNIYHATQAILNERGALIAVADEGGFWPSFATNLEGISILAESIEKAGYRPGDDVFIALDVAASTFYHNGKYCLSLEDRTLSRAEFVDEMASWAKQYPILSIEDGMAEDDVAGWQLLTSQMGNQMQLIGDDVFVTNADRIKLGAENGIANAVLIKLNQVGTITETMEAIAATRNAGYHPIISARSGETEDVSIVHLAIATGAGQLKVGSVARSERTAKWNEGIRIEADLGAAGYPGRSMFPWLG